MLINVYDLLTAVFRGFDISMIFTNGGKQLRLILAVVFSILVFNSVRFFSCNFFEKVSLWLDGVVCKKRRFPSAVMYSCQPCLLARKAVYYFIEIVVWTLLEVVPGANQRADTVFVCVQNCTACWPLGPKSPNLDAREPVKLK